MFYLLGNIFVDTCGIYFGVNSRKSYVQSKSLPASLRCDQAAAAGVAAEAVAVYTKCQSNLSTSVHNTNSLVASRIVFWHFIYHW